MTVFKTILLSIFWLSLTTNTWAAGLQNIESVKDENQVLSSIHDYLFQLEESIKETNQSLLETERKLETCLKDQSLILASANGSIYVVEKLNKLEDSVKQLEEDNFTKRDIVIQRRIDGSENFYRPWNDYKHGFGNRSGEFFIGLDVINKLTNSRSRSVSIYVSNLNGRYLNGTTKVFAQGVDWYQFRGHYYSLKYVEMILRPN